MEAIWLEGETGNRRITSGSRLRGFAAPALRDTSPRLGLTGLDFFSSSAALDGRRRFKQRLGVVNPFTLYASFLFAISKSGEELPVEIHIGE